MFFSKNSYVQINDDVFTSKGENNFVILNLQTGIYFGLDEMGAYLWELFVKHKKVSKVVQQVLSEYDVTEEQVLHDIDVFLKALVDHNLVTVKDYVEN